ncbi:hypothetical protein L1887_47068 [Cichorium endivia]|nr:hypothetical protein L1887_47068 [Cichorium endivia]
MASFFMLSSSTEVLAETLVMGVSEVPLVVPDLEEDLDDFSPLAAALAAFSLLAEQGARARVSTAIHDQDQQGGRDENLRLALGLGSRDGRHGGEARRLGWNADDAKMPKGSRGRIHGGGNDTVVASKRSVVLKQSTSMGQACLSVQGKGVACQVVEKVGECAVEDEMSQLQGKTVGVKEEVMGSQRPNGVLLVGSLACE